MRDLTSDYLRLNNIGNDLPYAGPENPDSAAPLDHFQVFTRSPHNSWNNYPSTNYDYYPTTYPDPYVSSESESVYTTLISSHHLYERKDKKMQDWTPEESMSWYLDTIHRLELHEFDWPPTKFMIPGSELRGLTKDEIIKLMYNPRIHESYSIRNGEKVYEILQECINSNNGYQRVETSTMFDLDTFPKQRHWGYNIDPNVPDHSNDCEDMYRYSDTASPELDCSDGSKSSDESENAPKKMPKRPPGRPRGSSKKVTKRPRSESVPEFLKNLLHNPVFCPSYIKFEDYSQGMFRFMKPDEVAKLWGQQKQNPNMTFEKFSRAMRYHYRSNVLVSVPTQRLVYKFGPKGPNYTTDNPNFLKPKSELDVHRNMKGHNEVIAF